MEEQTYPPNNEAMVGQTSPPSPPNNEAKKDSKSILLIIFAVVVTALIVGAGVFVWQDQQAKELENQVVTLQTQMEDLEKQIQEKMTDLEKEKTELEKKYCKGAWNNGVCVASSCVDSDVNEKPDDIYIKGSVTYTDENGVGTTVNDECNGSKTQVNEAWCYESPEGSGNYVQGKMVYNCENGCLDGACIY